MEDVDKIKETLKIAKQIVDETIQEKIEALIEENTRLNGELKNRAVRGFLRRHLDRLTSKAFIKFKVRETLNSMAKWAHRFAKSKYIIR